MPVLGDSTSTYVAEREGSLSMLAIHAYTHGLLRYHYTVPIHWWIFVAALVLLMTFMTSLPHLDRREPR